MAIKLLNRPMVTYYPRITRYLIIGAWSQVNLKEQQVHLLTKKMKNALKSIRYLSPTLMLRYPFVDARFLEESLRQS